jgi:acetyltransferase-like isoleucine patch superfamily enzyme
MKEGPLRGFANRILQHLARILPGAQTLRVSRYNAPAEYRLGRTSGFGYDVILDTSRPFLITLEDACALSMRVTVVAHFRGSTGIKIERDAFVGPGAIILPNVVVGRGAVVTAGSVVTRSVPPMTVVQGNPAVPVARCGIPLGPDITLKEFSQRLQLIAARRPSPTQRTETNSTKPLVAENEL